MIPRTCTISIHRRDGRRHRIWIPLLLLWPFIFALFAVLEILVIVACTVLLFVRPRDTVKIACALPATLYLLSQAAGTSVEFAGRGRAGVLVQLS